MIRLLPMPLTLLLRGGLVGRLLPGLLGLGLCAGAPEALGQQSGGGLAGTGLEISVAGDIVGQAGGGSPGGAPGGTNDLLFREGEILFYAPVDYLFDAQLSLAAHHEAGVMNWEIHEAYLATSRLVPRSRIRAGKYFLGVGRLNQFHRHDWPFVSAPKVHREFFAEEAAIDVGLEYSWLLPLPVYLDLTLGVARGWTWGHSHGAGAAPMVPTHYARLVTYSALGETGGMQIGANYLGRRAADGTSMVILGADFTAKWREGGLLRWLVQSETYYRAMAGDRQLGAYVYPQYGLNRQWSLGVRFDGFTHLSLKSLGGKTIGNLDFAVVPTLSFQASEFSTIRAALTWGGTARSDRGFGSEGALELQAVFLLGSHPAHDF